MNSDSVYMGITPHTRFLHADMTSQRLFVMLKLKPKRNEAINDAVTNLFISVKSIQGVQLNRLMRAYPSFFEFSLESQPYAVGNAAANDETIFILEFKIESRPASNVSIARVGITYSIPGQKRVDEFPVQNLVVQFVAGQMGVQVEQEVMSYVQQCNITRMVEEATQLAVHAPEKAAEKLEMAHKMTVRLGNQELSESLNQRLDELRKTRKLSAGTSKTVKLGAKGKTVRMGQMPFEISLLKPKHFAKGKTSNIKVQIYLPEYRNKVQKIIDLQEIESTEDKFSSAIRPYSTVKIGLDSQAFSIGRNDILKELKGEILNAVDFDVTPLESCLPGIQNAILYLKDAETDVELESFNFSLFIDDYAFDHISKPKVSYFCSLVTGIGAVAIFVLTFLQQVDATLGSTAGTAAAAAATFLSTQPTRLYNRQSVNKLSKP